MADASKMVSKEESPRHKLVTLFTYGSFPCIDGPRQTTKLEENKELNDLLKEGWFVQQVDVAADDTKVVDGMIYQVSTVMIFLSRDEFEPA